MSLPILHFARMPWPVDWAELYGREAPMIVDLGFGGGDSLVSLAQDNPSSNVLGIEISLPSLRRGAKKLSNAGLGNARVLQGDSFASLWLLFGQQSISSIAINFPDPWPKARHQHRRVINPRFLDLLASRMVAGAPLEIATDHEAYQEAIEMFLSASSYFSSTSSHPYVLSVEDRRQTKYERIALAEGRIPRYYLWQRNETDAESEFPIPEETAVPHIVFLSSLNLDELGERFEPFRVHDGDVHIKYLDLYRSVEREMLFAEVFVSEEPFPQRLGLSIRARNTGDFVLSVHEVGFPRPTPGIHLAVQHMISWLEEQDPDLTVVNSTLMDHSDSGMVE
jgi:tRNA (guanine-N7-)-methyltransferase